MTSFMEDFWNVFHNVFFFGKQATSLNRVWVRTLIDVLKMFEQMVIKIPKRSARSSLRVAALELVKTYSLISTSFDVSE